MEQKVIRIVEDKLGISERDYTLDSSFKDDLGCDSLDIIEVIMECEREFNIVIPDNAAERIITISDLVNYIKEHAK